MQVNKQMIKGSTETLILNLLQERPLYGYELIKELHRQSEGVFNLKEGTLYPILHAMEIEGWVESYWMEVEGRKRKYYSIRDKGMEALQSKKAEWNLFRRAVDRVLGEGGLT
ncbi:MAG: PadR family transcriptional regulator [Paenibacillus sp.]|uniref:PadR family transcriptional regulator n=1 Tax=Paenibacillus TaxID=44249 RepID=UPI0020A10692|nr:helix-turn-helix transcriptional regulator [Paenibacillus xylanexedens]MCP1426482.1 DNA-binding PadR family transcriptional regulator [Paenibacillus xylanexedens]